MTVAVSSINAAYNQESTNIHSTMSKSVTIICPYCGGYDWILHGYWLDDETWITLALECCNCGYYRSL